VALSGDELADAFSLFLSLSVSPPLSEDRVVIIRSAGSERRRASGRGRGRGPSRAREGERKTPGLGDERRGSNTAAQNSQSNPTKQITPNFPGDRATRPLLSLHAPCIPANLDQREPGVGAARGGYRARQRFISRCPYFRSPSLSLPLPLSLCLSLFLRSEYKFQGTSLVALHASRATQSRAIQADARSVTSASKCIARRASGDTARANASQSRCEPFRQFRCRYGLLAARLLT